MAVKTFSVNEVLTASDTNTYLANGGLVYVASGTATNAASFDVTGFTSTYSMFKIIMEIWRHSGAGGTFCTAQLVYGTTPVTSADYFGSAFNVNFAGTAASTGARNGGTNFQVCATYAQDPSRVEMTVGGMNTTSTQFNCFGQYYDMSGSAGGTLGYQTTSKTNALDKIRISNSVNISATWTLYGYRKG